MYEIVYRAQGVGEHRKYKYADVYVKDRAEALAISTQSLTQGSKLYIAETAELFVLNEDAGIWCSSVDGTSLS